MDKTYNELIEEIQNYMEVDIVKSMKAAQELLNNHIDDPTAWYWHAWTKLSFGDIDLAVKEFKQVVEMSPNNPMGYYGLAKCYFQKGDYVKAFPYYDKTVLSYLDNLDYLEEFLITVEMLEGLDSSIEHAKKLLQAGATEELKDALADTYLIAAQSYIKDITDPTDKSSYSGFISLEDLIASENYLKLAEETASIDQKSIMREKIEATRKLIESDKAYTSCFKFIVVAKHMITTFAFYFFIMAVIANMMTDGALGSNIFTEIISFILAVGMLVGPWMNIFANKVPQYKLNNCDYNEIPVKNPVFWIGKRLKYYKTLIQKLKSKKNNQ